MKSLSFRDTEVHTEKNAKGKDLLKNILGEKLKR